MALTTSQIKAAKPDVKQYKIFDRDNLHLLVRPNGSKTWKYGFRLNGKQNTYTIGSFPDVSLAEAREEASNARKLVQRGLNPTTERRALLTKTCSTHKVFSAYCDEWIAKQNLQASTEKDLKQRLKKNIYPDLDKAPVNQFTTRDLYDVLKKMTDRGTKETAMRMAGVLRRVYNELFLLGIVESNPAQGLAELLPKVDQQAKGNFAHITSATDLKMLLLAIHKPAPRRNAAVSQALKLMPLLFLRPKNIRFMKWEHIDFDAALLTIPGSEMKMRKELKVPLANQAIDILREVEKTRHMTSSYVFTTAHGNGKPMSENTTTYAIKRLRNPDTGVPFGTGFMTSHGFRHTASTMLNEMGHDSDAIELQLSHESKDRIRATYNKAQLMDKRRQMMQDWADYLDSLIQSSL